MKTNLVCKHSMKLIFSNSEAFSISAINNQDDNLLHLERKIIHLVKVTIVIYCIGLSAVGKDTHLCVTVIRVPGSSEILLATNVPDEEACFLYGNFLYVAANCGRSLHGFFC